MEVDGAEGGDFGMDDLLERMGGLQMAAAGGGGHPFWSAELIGYFRSVAQVKAHTEGLERQIVALACGRDAGDVYPGGPGWAEVTAEVEQAGQVCAGRAAATDSERCAASYRLTLCLLCTRRRWRRLRRCGRRRPAGWRPARATAAVACQGSTGTRRRAGGSWSRWSSCPPTAKSG